MGIARFRAWLVAAVAGLALSGPSAVLAATPQAVPAGATSGETLTYDIERSRMTVPVMVGGRGPYRFVVDTGADRTVISRQLAEQLALGPGEPATVHSMTEVSEIGTVVIPDLQVGQRTLSNVQAPALLAANLGAVGMLGVDSLQHQRVEFDFARRQMSIHPARRRMFPWAGVSVELRGERHLGRLMIANAEVDGEEVVVIIDTGSQITVANPALRAALARNGKVIETAPIELRSITGGRMPAEYGIARNVRIGGVTLSNLPISFANAHPFRQLDLDDRPALLLGMDTLRLFERVSVDFLNRRVRLLLTSRGPSGIQTRDLDPAGARLTN